MFSHKIGRLPRPGQIRHRSRPAFAPQSAHPPRNTLQSSKRGSSQSGLCSADRMKVPAAKIGPLTLNQRVPRFEPLVRPPSSLRKTARFPISGAFFWRDFRPLISPDFYLCERFTAFEWTIFFALRLCNPKIPFPGDQPYTAQEV